MLVEFHNPGFNVITISSITTAFLTIWQMWGLKRQSDIIFKNRSASSLEPITFIYLLFFAISVISYGIGKNSLSLIFSGLNACFYIPIVYGIYKFSGFKLHEWVILILLLVMPIAMIMSKYKDILYLLYASIATLSLMQQLIKIIITRNVKGLNVMTFVTFLAGGIIWLSYGIATLNWALMIPNFLNVSTFASIIYLIKKYNRPIS